MSSVKRVVIATLTLALLLPASASADSMPRERALVKYSALYHKCKDSDQCKAGRNIRRHGVRFKWVSEDGKRSHWVVRPATAEQVADEIRRMRKATEQPYYVLPWYIVSCESKGDWAAVNTSNPDRPAGAYQIITGTWLAYGGGEFAPTADQATWREQNIVALRIWAGGSGASHWACA